MVTIRRAVVADAAKLSLVGGASFLESFADDHPGDDLVDHVVDRHSVAVYQDWLADPAFAVWIVEEALGAPIGYAMLGPATLPGGTATDSEIKRIYVLRRWHARGLGRDLFAAAVAEAIARGSERLLLAVYKANALAIAFYERQGMTVIGETVFMVGETKFYDQVMAKPLNGTAED
jgi:diamine N-acetyltransferase